MKTELVLNLIRRALHMPKVAIGSRQSAIHLFCLFASLRLCVETFAQSSPFLIPFQGRLTNPSDVPYTNGQYTILFNLYDQPVGGTLLWSETHQNAGVINGMVNVFLGSINPALSTVDFSQTRYLGITIDADGNPNTPDPEMVPRQMIIPAFWAKNSENLSGYNWTPIFGVNSPIGQIPGNKIQNYGITAGQIANGTITAAQIANNTITAQQLAGAIITSNQIANWTITSSNLNQNLLLALSVPPGTISAYGGIVAPTGWLICDGSALSSSQYPSLYGAISNYWGSGYMFQGNVWAQGTNNFNLPDLRGLFLRGVLGTRTNFVSIGQVPDPDSSSRTNNVPGGNTGGNVGSVQTDQFRAHVHPATIGGGYVENGVGDGLGTGGNAGGVAANTGSAGGSETRPANAYVNYIIKY